MTSAPHSAPISVILPIEGERLTPSEKQLFSKIQPVGFLLLGRNCAHPEQLKSLTAEIRDVTGSAEILIAIDQEGGRVQRLRAPHWPDFPSAQLIEQLSQTAGIQASERSAYLCGRLIASVLHEHGLNMNCAPVCDLRLKGAHEVIGERAYSERPEIVSLLAGQYYQGSLQGAVLPVIKHLPGHGRAKADSHKELPHVSASLDELRQTDFACFKDLAPIADFAMSAHIIFDQIDPENPATLSPKIIKDIIQKEMSFKGLLISDALEMEALKGSYLDRAKKILSAGCDIALYCNGPFADTEAMLNELPPLNPEQVLKLKHALGSINSPPTQDVSALWSELKEITKGAGLAA